MSALEQVKVPDIGGFADVDVIEVLVAEGDEIAAEQSLITLESDKATMEVPSPMAGVVRRLHVKLGDTVSEGSVIAEIETAGAAVAAAPAPTPPATPPATAAPPPAPVTPPPAESAAADIVHPPPAAAPQAEAVSPPPPAAQPSVTPPSQTPPPESSTALPHASPGVRKLAREWGIDLDQVTASGSSGRITEDDLNRYRAAQAAPPPAASAVEIPAAVEVPAASAPPPTVEPPAPVAQQAAAAQPVAPTAAPAVDFTRYGDTEVRPLGRIRKIAGANLHRNWTTIPHVTQHDEADITELEIFRKENDLKAREQGTRLTLVTFLIKAAVAALKNDPEFNSSLAPDGENLVLKRYFHIGIAVDTPNGLVVPVIRDCDQKGLIDLAMELMTVSGRAREGKLTPADMQGGCFSISSLGGIGGTAFTPIVNAPEVAILGVSRAQMKPVWIDEQFEPRLMLPLSLSYDHRVIDGAAAARFTRFIASRLEDFRRVLL